MLDLEAVDLTSLSEALEDNSHDHSWWLDPRSGQVEVYADHLVEDDSDDHPEERGLVPIEPIGSHEAYADLEDFTARVRDPRARDLLERAIAGRGAFRRFKDTLFDFPELRQAWFAFHDARMERRAIEWLAAEGLLEEDTAEEAARARPDPDPPELGGPFDPFDVARAVAADLHDLYGSRLREVRLFGSWARGDAHPESDLDLLVVLDRVDSPWEEGRTMADVLWRHSDANDTVVSAMAASEADLTTRSWPALIRAVEEGQSVA